METKQLVMDLEFEKSNGNGSTTYLTHNFHTYPAKLICSLSILFVLAFDTNVAIGFKSRPIAFLLRSYASTNVVPQPQKGSKIVSPFLVKDLIVLFGICGINLAGYVWKL